MLVGLDANIAAWQHTSIGWLWRLLRLPVIYPIASHIYNQWARWRFQRLYQDSNPVVSDYPATE
jgi:predicted DCC family thiol-disulfide oxidoreductase YuxK